MNYFRIYKSQWQKKYFKTYNLKPTIYNKNIISDLNKNIKSELVIQDNNIVIDLNKTISKYNFNLDNDKRNAFILTNNTKTLVYNYTSQLLQNIGFNIIPVILIENKMILMRINIRVLNCIKLY